MVRPPELFEQGALLAEGARVPDAQAVVRRHVHGRELAAGAAGRDAGTAAQQGLTLGAAGQGDEHALAGLPTVVDAVLGAVGLERVVDLVGEPEQGDLAQAVRLPSRK